MMKPAPTKIHTSNEIAGRCQDPRLEHDDRRLLPETYTVKWEDVEDQGM